MKTIAYALIAASLATVTLMPVSSSAAQLKSSAPKSFTGDGDRGSFMALYGTPAQAETSSSVLKSNGSNFPGAADLPDDSSLRLGNF